MLRWIPMGTGQLYIVTSDFHIARATYTFQVTLDYFYKMAEDVYRHAPEWTAPAKKYPRLTIHQAATRSFCGSDATRNRDNDPKADINLQSLAKRAKSELNFLGSMEVSHDFWIIVSVSCRIASTETSRSRLVYC